MVVSDGRDTTSRDEHDFESTLRRLSSDECQIYVVQTGVYENANVRDLAAERRMQEFAAQTGGAAYIPRSVDDLERAFAQISADLAQQYILSYYPDMDKRDGKYHLINVRVKSPVNTRVRARRGFLVKSRATMLRVIQDSLRWLRLLWLMWRYNRVLKFVPHVGSSSHSIPRPSSLRAECERAYAAQLRE